MKPGRSHARDAMRSEATLLITAPDPARDRTARRNLAAMVCDLHGVDPTNPDRTAAHLAAVEFKTLSQILGLDPPDTPTRSRCPNCRRYHVDRCPPSPMAGTVNARARARWDRIVKLREQGLLFREIGHAVGLSESGAQQAYKSAMAERAAAS